MDPRNIPQNPFARPPSETSTRDPRGPPIPPPPYTLQAPVRQPQPTFTNDPFLPRRNDLDGSRQEIHRTVSQSPFSLEKYAAGLPREPPGSATVSAEGKLRDTNGSWSLGDRIMNGYRSQDMKGEPVHWSTLPSLGSGSRRAIWAFPRKISDSNSLSALFTQLPATLFSPSCTPRCLQKLHNIFSL